jgi:hypothetical protein
MRFICAIVNALSFTIGGAAAGGRLPLRMVALFLACLVCGILLQNIGRNTAAQRMPGRIGIRSESYPDMGRSSDRVTRPQTRPSPFDQDPHTSG